MQITIFTIIIPSFEEQKKFNLAIPMTFYGLVFWLINSLLSNPVKDIHYMQYTSVKNPASHKGL